MRVNLVILSLHGRLLNGFDIGNGWLGLVGPGLEKDFKADYWVYTDCTTVYRFAAIAAG